jgi:hypothetical protein
MPCDAREGAGAGTPQTGPFGHFLRLSKRHTIAATHGKQAPHDRCSSRRVNAQDLRMTGRTHGPPCLSDAKPVVPSA